MRLNAVEEWTVRNVTDEWHTLHIHINPYQVIRINGKPVKPILWDDNVVIGPNGGSVTWRTRFTDFTGKFVMHCHVLFHGQGDDGRRPGGAGLGPSGVGAGNT
jgi:FtsP/CotA-like multicopper oxidase with cupredoxin domain